jgi:hypothetical protein
MLIDLGFVKGKIPAAYMLLKELFRMQSLNLNYLKKYCHSGGATSTNFIADRY